tara:strand:+ start:1497 stop:2063 length:567 start_codon:yes stop_codon:yes gene_type:complete
MDSEEIFEKPIDEPKEASPEVDAPVEEVKPKPKKEKKPRKKRTMTDEQREAMLARLKAGREKSMRNRKEKSAKKKKLEKKRKELQEEYVDKELEKYTTERKPVKRPADTHEIDKPAKNNYNHKENSQKLHNKIDRLEQMILNMNKPKKSTSPLVTMAQVNNRVKKKSIPKPKPKPLVSLSTYRPRKWF